MNDLHEAIADLNAAIDNQRSALDRIRNGAYQQIKDLRSAAGYSILGIAYAISGGGPIRASEVESEAASVVGYRAWPNEVKDTLLLFGWLVEAVFDGDAVDYVCTPPRREQ